MEVASTPPTCYGWRLGQTLFLSILIMCYWEVSCHDSPMVGDGHKPICRDFDFGVSQKCVRLKIHSWLSKLQTWIESLNHRTTGFFGVVFQFELLANVPITRIPNTKGWDDQMTISNVGRMLRGMTIPISKDWELTYRHMCRYTPSRTANSELLARGLLGAV